MHQMCILTNHVSSVLLRPKEVGRIVKTERVKKNKKIKKNK
jgi:hypothetical protein